MVSMPDVRVGDVVIFFLPKQYLGDGKLRERPATVIQVDQDTGTVELAVTVAEEDTDVSMAPIRRYRGVRFGEAAYHYALRVR